MTVPAESESAAASRRTGLLISICTYCCWGLTPLLLRALRPVPALNVLSFRVVGSLFILVGLTLATARTPVLVAALRKPRTLATLAFSACVIGGNWLLYIHGVNIGEVLDVSLGYFIIPFVSAGVGALILGERLDRLSQTALVMAAIAVGLLVVERRALPAISLELAGSFVLYAFVRKTAAVDALEGMTIETALLFPFALFWLWQNHGFAMSANGPSLSFVSIAAGAMAIPMLLFTIAAKRLPLADLGFLQYISPSIQLALALTIFEEHLPPSQLAAFLLIGSALLIYIYARWRGGAEVVQTVTE